MDCVEKRALFLDRDGVVNIEKNYLYKEEDFEFMDGIFELCRFYTQKGYLIFIVTNQSGIARGYYSEYDFEVLTHWMENKFLQEGIVISHTYHCPHHPLLSGECECRKPKPGMLTQAQKDFGIRMNNSIMIGDKERDIEAALNAGIETTYLLDEDGSGANSKATRVVHKLNEIWSS